MNTVDDKRFRKNLTAFIDEVTASHAPLRVTKRDGKALVIMSEKEWRRERETLYVLQNSDLMKQIAASALTYKQGTGDTASMPFCNT